MRGRGAMSWSVMESSFQATPPFYRIYLRCSAKCKREKDSDATNKSNCYFLALDSLGKGKYVYWINGAKFASQSFDDDTKSIAKAQAKDGDFFLQSRRTCVDLEN